MEPIRLAIQALLRAGWSVDAVEWDRYNERILRFKGHKGQQSVYIACYEFNLSSRLQSLAE
jgi:hypothetical protein